MEKPQTWFLLLLVGLGACTGEEERADAYGHFEAEEVRVSAQVAGPLLYFPVEEGQRLEAGRLVALVDTLPLSLQRDQIRAAMQSLRGKLQDPSAEIAVLEQQRAVLERERGRLQRLLEGQAATRKQLDDLEGQLAVVERQITAARSRADQANRAVLSELEPLQARLRQVEDQLARCRVHNPVAGTVLATLAEAGEVVAPGRPLYVIAPTDTLVLRAYVSGPQLSELRIGQSVEVRIDGPQGQPLPFQGQVVWIADEAEFTPKTVQTRQERVHLVYALKVRVPNDGRLKIG
ncbi:MAG: HlyD family efflux transporter periplasmic adaptor subunit, partial [Bacteroidetes bacterium]